MPPQLTESRLAKRIARVFDDPHQFVRFYWPDIRLYDKQLEVLNSVKDNVETFVYAGAALGKDFITSLVVLWYFQSRAPCKVVISSTSEDHLRTVLWGEIQERLRTARFPMHVKVDYLRVRRYTDAKQKEFDPMSWIEGRVLSSVERFAGVHLDNDKPRVLLVFDEASGIADAFYEAAQSWRHRLLVIGNPLNTTNFFYRVSKAGDRPNPAGPGLMQKVIHIGSMHSPNVIWGKTAKEMGKKYQPPPPEIRIPGIVSWEEHLQRKAQWDEYNLCTRDEGYFHEGAESLLYPPQWLDLAEAAHLEIEKEYGSRPRPGTTMGVDGGEGRALTAWTIVDKRGIVHHEAAQTPDTMKISGNTIRLMKSWGVQPSRVYFDRGGGGKQIADRMRELGYNVNTVGFGEAANPIIGTKTKRLGDRRNVEDSRRAYKNRRAEMYGILRELLNPATNEKPFGIPALYHELRAELAPLPLLYDSEGVMFLPPKNRPPGAKSTTVTIHDILGHSPDRADSLVLAAYGLQARTKRVLGAFA